MRVLGYGQDIGERGVEGKLVDHGKVLFLLRTTDRGVEGESRKKQFRTWVQLDFVPPPPKCLEIIQVLL